jgi:hypothetical protein
MSKFLLETENEYKKQVVTLKDFDRLMNFDDPFNKFVLKEKLKKGKEI